MLLARKTDVLKSEIYQAYFQDVVGIQKGCLQMETHFLLMLGRKKDVSKSEHQQAEIVYAVGMK